LLATNILHCKHEHTESTDKSYEHQQSVSGPGLMYSFANYNV